MTDQHTPGPWSHAGPSDIGRDGYSIYASGPLAYTAGPSDYGDAAEANARLIAASPELLVALRDLMDAEGGEPGMTEDQKAAWLQAEAAIAKATGEVRA
jgi:hypothetical protein